MTIQLRNNQLKVSQTMKGNKTSINDWDKIDTVYTVPEVATILKMSKSKLYDLVKRDRIPYLKIGRNVRIRQSDLNRWLEDHSRYPN